MRSSTWSSCKPLATWSCEVGTAALGVVTALRQLSELRAVVRNEGGVNSPAQ